MYNISQKIFKEIKMGITLLKLLIAPCFLQTKNESTQGFKPKIAYKLKILGE